MLLVPEWAISAEEDPDELFRKGRFKEAEQAYARADMDRPRDIRFRYNRGCAAYQGSDFQGARGAFSSVVSRTEDDRRGTRNSLPEEQRGQGRMFVDPDRSQICQPLR